MTADVLPTLPLTEVSELLIQRKASPVELTQACLDRIESANGQVNALVFVDPETAIAQAAEAQQRYALRQPLGLLDGLPIVVKDNIAVSGWPMTNGLAVQHTSSADADIVSRLRRQGVVMLGSANMDEGALAAAGVNPHHGRIMNPDFPGYASGGSSSGSAAAVAAGFCCAALGTDTLGSVRLPAAYCGLVGFKPSHGRLSTTGIISLLPELDAVGPITRSVADVVYLMTQLEGWTVSVEQLPLGYLRWGVPDSFSGEELDVDVQVPFESALAGLSAVVRPQPVALRHWDPGTLRRSGLLLAEHHAACHWTDPASAYSARLRSMLQYGREASADRLARAQSCVRESKSDLLASFTEVDVILMPTTPQTAFDSDTAVPVNQADYTALANAAGCPSISIPCLTPAAGRPAGLQLMSAPGSDEKLLAWALQVERLLADC